MNPDPHYTLFIRLPFPRSNFEDPPPVQWDVSKDQQLWKAISSASSSRELDWDALSRKFDAPLSFLLQQAAWLYERHFEGMKAQMKKLSVATAVSAPATPTPDAEGQGRGSGGASSRIPPAINTRHTLLMTQKESASDPSTPKGGMPVISRTPSTNTVTQSRVFASSRQFQRRPLSSRGMNTSSGKARRTSLEDGDASAFPDDRTMEEDSEDDADIARTNTFSTYRSAKESQTGTLSSDADAEDDEDEGDSSGGFLPFAASSKATKGDPTATIRNSPRKQTSATRQEVSTKPVDSSPPPSSSVSSASSAQQHPSQDSQAEQTNPRSGALSPQQRAQLARLSPRYRRSGSEGSPSMGSSFSDLDDASITQSALGEALLSNMQHGSIGMGSRMSTLRDALGRRQQ